MTELEQVRIAQEAIMTYYSTDDPEIKAYALSINAGVSPEAVRIHREATVIDTCSFYLESYNWHLKESGVTALNLTVPQNLAGTGSAVNSIIDLSLIHISFGLCFKTGNCVILKGGSDAINTNIAIV